ncbi:hypothetical protein [Streptomyces albipurpureus]|uniref:Uncharacterized protein n=1 Tax=Streptomyces albipurpureus TaxID=2897419 RepID=A0ABT0UUL7_9ACTN|nr:hypothetical protein [Streptomyces sp. CWNU-1]MCM2391805.1 hypothetical protein [Streptomyces sp. CWNU-1]
MRADLTGPRRGRLSLVASVAALSIATATAPAIAAPNAPGDPAPVGVGVAATDQIQRGVFQVTAWTDAPSARIQKVSARIRQDERVIADVDSVPELAGDPGTFRISAANPLKLTEDGGSIPELGRYAIDVTATDDKGNTVTRKNAGTLNFTLRPGIGFQVGKPTFDDRNARPQGRLIGYQPGSNDSVPLPGRTVEVTRTDGRGGPTHQVVTTDSGEFTSPAFALTAPAGEFRATFAETSAQVNGQASHDARVWQWATQRLTVSASADKARVLPGERLTVDGRVLSGTEPVANTAMRVRLTRDYQDTVVTTTVTTDADGRFTAQLPATPDNKVTGWIATPDDPFQSGTAIGQVAMPSESSLGVLSASLSADGVVTVSGTFRGTYQSGSTYQGGQWLQIEHSVDGKNGWKPVGTGDTSLADSGGWYAHTYTLRSKSTTGGYFRVRHLVSDEFAESVSPVFRLARAETRVTGINAAPEPIGKGKTITVAGLLSEKKGSGWKGIAKAPVELWFKPSSGTRYARVSTGKTDSAGRAKLTAKATVDGTWLIRYLGDSTRFNSTGVGDWVDVR